MRRFRKDKFIGNQYACFVCRKVFKKTYEIVWLSKGSTHFNWPAYTCPQCSKKMTYMGYKFRAPKKTDKKEWSRIERKILLKEEWGVRTVRKAERNPPLKPRYSKELQIALGIRKR